MSTSVRHDPFARQSFVRSCTANPRMSCGTHSGRMHCDWCGQTPARLFNYVTCPDDRNRVTPAPYGNWFCNLGCFDSYNS